MTFKSKTMKIIAGVLSALLMVSALVYYNFIDKGTKSFVAVGQECPNFVAKPYEVNGDKFSLSNDVFRLVAQREKKVCVINFWATWCEPCIKELPEFNHIQEEYANDVTVIAIVVANPASGGVDPTAKWMSQKGWTWADTAHDWVDFSLTLAYLPKAKCEELGASGALPRTVIVDKDGIVTYAANTSMNYDTLKAEVNKALNK